MVYNGEDGRVVMLKNINLIFTFEAVALTLGVIFSIFTSYDLVALILIILGLIASVYLKLHVPLEKTKKKGKVFWISFWVIAFVLGYLFRYLPYPKVTIFELIVAYGLINDFIELEFYQKSINFLRKRLKRL